MAMQVNKLNPRKEFFRVSLTDIHQEIERLKQGEDFIVKAWTELAIATEYKESLDIDSDPGKKEKWLTRQSALAERVQRKDTLPLSVSSDSETAEDNEEA